MRAAVYLRVSSDKQAAAGSIESQRRDVPAYAARMGWQIVDTYEDDGKSAGSGHLDARDGFARLLADAGAGRFDVVVGAEVDRFTRAERSSSTAARSPYTCTAPFAPPWPAPSRAVCPARPTSAGPSPHTCGSPRSPRPSAPRPRPH